MKQDFNWHCARLCSLDLLGVTIFLLRDPRYMYIFVSTYAMCTYVATEGVHIICNPA